MQLRYLLLAMYPTCSLASPSTCSESSKDIVSLIQTRSTVRAKSGNRLPQEESLAASSLLQMKGTVDLSSLSEFLPEDFFTQDSLNEPTATETLEHNLEAAVSRTASKPSVSLEDKIASRKSNDKIVSSKSSDIKATSNENIVVESKQAPPSFIQHTASVLDSNGNRSELLLQTSLKPAEVQDAAKQDCTPKCSWMCASSKCDQVCKPKCQAPMCETRCSGMDTSSCTMECFQPQCAVICPAQQCTTGCAKCQTECSDPKCKLNCPGLQPCKNVCEEPKCEWECQAPKDCPIPKCQLHCEKPKACTQTYHKGLPDLEVGQVKVLDFKAVGNHSSPPPCGNTVALQPGQVVCDDSVVAATSAAVPAPSEPLKIKTTDST